MEKVKMNTKKLKYGTASIVITVIVIAVIVLINVILGVASDRVNMKLDLTENKVFDISQESIDYINSLNEPVEIVTMVDESMFLTSSYIYYKQAYEVLKKYSSCSDNVTVKFVDMTKNPTYVNKYKEVYKDSIDQYDIVVSCGERIKVMSINDLYNTEVDYNTMTNSIVSSKAEQALTSAIMYVTDPNPMKAVIFSTKSAGESSDNITAMIQSNGFDTVILDPATEEIPADADLIVICSPVNDYSPEIINKLYAFLENDGKYGRNLIYTADFAQTATPNIDAFLSEWGLQVGDGIVAESNSNNIGSNESVFGVAIPEAFSETYAANIAQPELPIVANYTRPVNVLFETSGIIKTTPLLTTTDTTYIVTQEMLEGAQTDPVVGAQGIMAVSTKTTFDADNNQISSNIMVIGSSYILAQDLTEQSYCNNGDFFVSAVNYMTGKAEGITVVAKDLSSTTFEISEKTSNIMQAVFMFIIPVAVLAVGVIVWLRRRHK